MAKRVCTTDRSSAKGMASVTSTSCEIGLCSEAVSAMVFPALEARTASNTSVVVPDRDSAIRKSQSRAGASEAANASVVP